MLPSHPFGQEANKEIDEEEEEEEEEEEGELMMLEIADDEEGWKESATADAAKQPGFEMVLEEEEQMEHEQVRGEENKVDIHAQLEQLRLEDKE
jgi:hypothetical protein